MLLGDILMAHGLVELEDIEKALAHQREVGGRLGENLMALGLVAPEDLQRIIRETPAAPTSIDDTGIPGNDLLRLLIKTIHAGSLELPSAMSGALKLPTPVINQLLAAAIERRLAENLGMSQNGGPSESRYQLTEAGRAYAIDAQHHNQYVGPAPVSLAAYTDRILRQRITNERIDYDAIQAAFADLVIPEASIRRIGPGINAGRSILLYGPPGNGKTSIAERIAQLFSNVIYIPYCITVDGQIIQIFDPNLHRVAIDEADCASRPKSLFKEEFDGRWVPCRRPVVITGGELTLEMLDLQFNEHAKFYEAPLHIKALGGTFLIDDFGRQLVSPRVLLNRWIVPLESRVDYLKLHTGKSFAVPFDELVIFSTNMSPSDLMDPAFLRRIPYKLKIDRPSRGEFRRIFQNVATSHELELEDGVCDYVIEEIEVKNSSNLACYQAKFFADQVVASCKFAGTTPAFNRNMISEAMLNLYTQEEQQDSVVTDHAGVNGHVRVEG